LGVLSSGWPFWVPFWPHKKVQKDYSSRTTSKEFISKKQKIYNMKPHSYLWIMIPVIILATLSGCKKYLDAKPNQSLAVPTSLQDAFALLNDHDFLHAFQPVLPFISSDNFYNTDSYISAGTANDKDAYLWETDVANTAVTIWRNPYAAIQKVNTAIQVLEKIVPGPDEENAYKAYLGKAYFIRAWQHYTIARLFAQPYTSAIAATTPGIPIKLLPDIDEPVVRGTLAGTYAQIMADINYAISLLPATVQQNYLLDRPAALLLKADIALQMHAYDTALLASTSALQLRPGLMDYNTLDSNAALPFKRFNAEVLYHAIISGSGMLGSNNWRCDTVLIKEYHPNDLRFKLFFKPSVLGNYGFRGNYAGVGELNVFCGLSNNETYLIKAECEARKGQVAAAMQTLNALLITRWRKGTFGDYTASNAAEALQIILKERRKELVGRHNRWHDLRRLNAGDNANITIRRIYLGKEYVLTPGDKHYTFLIPQSVIDLSGIAQNPR
jgi:hypothetical protein